MTATDSVSNSIKALFSLSFAAPLYGVELGIRAGRFAKSGSGRAVDALTAVTQSMVSQLTSFAATVTPPAPQQMLFSLINEIQKSVTGDLSRAAAGDLSGLSVDGEQLKEMLNKWRIFVSVPFVKRMVGLETSQSLRESVEKSYAPGPYIARGTSRDSATGTATRTGSAA